VWKFGSWQPRFKEWAEQYGGVFSLKFGPGTMIVLADRKAIHELLDKRGNIYSERPFNYIASLVTHGDSFAFMDNTPQWRSQRKIAAHNFSVRWLPPQCAREKTDKGSLACWMRKLETSKMLSK